MIKDYSELALEHYFHPRHVGELDVDDDHVFLGVAGSKAGGDIIQLFVRIVEGVITDATFKAHGSCATIAAASWLTENIIGQNVNDVGRLTSADIISALSLSSVKQQSALLAEDALKNALIDPFC